MLIDHFVWVASDLELEMERFRDKAGIKPELGGSHPGKGTHNALVRIGQASYLEIIAPDPRQPEVDRPWMMPEFVGDSRLIKWAWKSTDISIDSGRMDAVGCPVGCISTGKRLTDEGKWLHWQLTDPDFSDSLLVPFLINWPDDQHPTRSLPFSCQLRSVSISFPLPGQLRFIDLLLDFPGKISEGTELFTLDIEGPRRIVRLSSQAPYFQVI